ncbi:hypothetical protein [Streptomyces anulatus]
MDTTAQTAKVTPSSVLAQSVAQREKLKDMMATAFTATELDAVKFAKEFDDALLEYEQAIDAVIDKVDAEVLTEGHPGSGAQRLRSGLPRRGPARLSRTARGRSPRDSWVPVLTCRRSGAHRMCT